MLTRFFTDPVIYFVIFWLPEYLRKERHFDLAMVGRYSWVPFLFGGIGYLLGGWLSGLLMRARLAACRGAQICDGDGRGGDAGGDPGAVRAHGGAGDRGDMLHHFRAWACGLPTCRRFRRICIQARRSARSRGFSGAGGAVGGMLAQLGTGYLVMNFSYAPVFILAGLMHPLSAVLTYWLLPDRYFAVKR